MSTTLSSSDVTPRYAVRARYLGGILTETPFPSYADAIAYFDEVRAVLRIDGAAVIEITEAEVCRFGRPPSAGESLIPTTPERTLAL